MLERCRPERRFGENTKQYEEDMGSRNLEAEIAKF